MKRLTFYVFRFMLKSLGLWKTGDSGESRSTSSTAAEEVVAGDVVITSSSPHHTSSSSRSSSTSSSRKRRLSKDDSLLSHSQDTSSLLSHTKESSLISYTKDSSLLSSTKDSESIHTRDSTTLSQQHDMSLISLPKDDTSITSHLEDGFSIISKYIDSSSYSQPRENIPILRDNDRSYPTPPKPPLESSLSLTTIDSSTLHDSSNMSDDSSDTLEGNPDSPLPYQQHLYNESKASHLRQQSDMSKTQLYDALGGSEDQTIEETAPSDTTKSSDKNTDVPDPKGISALIIGPPGIPKQSSLVIHPAHRRQLSEGSRVSFQERSTMSSGRTSSIIFPRSHSIVSHNASQSASDSVHITCHNLNFDTLKNFEKPDINEIKANIQKLPKLAYKG